MKRYFLIAFCLLVNKPLIYAQCAKIDSLERVLTIVQDVKTRTDAVNLLSFHYLTEQLGRAYYYAQIALQSARYANYEKGVGDAYRNIARVHSFEPTHYEQAFEEYDKSLKIYQNLNLEEELALTHEEKGKLYYEKFYSRQVNYQKSIDHYLQATKFREKQDNKQKMVDNYDMLGELYSHLGNDKLALEYFKRAVDMREKYKMGISNDSRLLAKAKKVYDLELKNQQLNNYLLLAAILVLGLLAFILIITLVVNRRRNQLLQKQKAEIELQNTRLQDQKELIEEQKGIIEIEQKLTNSFNFMPPAVFEEIKDKGFAEPRQYDKVSILFSDLEHFTSISKNFSTKELITELNNCFNHFDEIIENYHLIKLKTLGDTYMCAGGLPRANHTNPVEMVLAALEMNRFTQKIRADKAAKGEPFWHLRIGINTGYVLAGVIGQKKIAYDVWGESVSLAKKMEDRCPSDKITISEYTYEYVKDFFDFEPRVDMKVKPTNFVEDYVVKGIKAELSENEDGITPNRLFKEKMAELARVEA
jgi:class 3 adenylate cyclase